VRDRLAAVDCLELCPPRGSLAVPAAVLDIFGL
jgi:hypothetical protein